MTAANLDSLWAGMLAARATDQAPKLVLADALLEAGDESAADCLRWLAAKGRRPVRRAGLGYYWWDCQDDSPPRGPDDIPPPLIRAMAKYPWQVSHCGDSRRKVYQDLVAAWAKIVPAVRAACWAWKAGSKKWSP